MRLSLAGRITGLPRPTACLSFRLFHVGSKTKKRRIKIVVNVPHDSNDRCANFQSKDQRLG